MSESPQSFVDPKTYPIVFKASASGTVIMYGQTGFPVSFVFDPYPRQAYVRSLASLQLGSFLVSQDVFDQASIYQFPSKVSETFQLVADSKDILSANFYLKVPKLGGGWDAKRTGSVIEVRQTQADWDAYHTFSMTPSTQLFDPYKVSGTKYFPTVTLYLDFHKHLQNCSYVWADVLLPDKQDSKVLFSKANAYGIMDIMATVKIKWYFDSARTSPAPAPVQREEESFGIRYYCSQGQYFLARCAESDSGTGIINGVYPTSLAITMGGGPIEIFYWGGGDREQDLFYGEESAITISDAGLPIQSSVEVGAYILANQLIDLDTSSSSLSSMTSANSSISSDSSLSSSTVGMSSSISSSSTLSLSSSSTVAQLTSSGSSSSSSSSSTSSTVAKSSSSSSSFTTTMRSSSSSSYSSSSSIGGSLVLYYSFDTKEDVYRRVVDESVMSNDAFLATLSGAYGPPVWQSSGGVSNGCYSFSGASSYSTYLRCQTLAGISSQTQGTITFWMKAGVYGNSISYPVCIEKAFSSVAQQLCFSVDRSIYRQNVSCQFYYNGTCLWKIESSPGSLSTGEWIFVGVTHDGSQPRLFINGVEDSYAFTCSDDKTAWMSLLCSGTYAADTVVAGASLLLAYASGGRGFSGLLDEIKIWDVRLTSPAMLTEYLKFESSSSSNS